VIGGAASRIRSRNPPRSSSARPSRSSINVPFYNSDRKFPSVPPFGGFAVHRGGTDDPFEWTDASTRCAPGRYRRLDSEQRPRQQLVALDAQHVSFDMLGQIRNPQIFVNINSPGTPTSAEYCRNRDRPNPTGKCRARHPTTWAFGPCQAKLQRCQITPNR